MDIDLDVDDERFGLIWSGKRRARQLAQSPSSAALSPVPAESIDWETTRNVMIEGENLESLKALQRAYNKQVKMIYIDPPYNTGREFIYSDNYQDNVANYLHDSLQLDQDGNRLSANPETSGRFHTKWLNMMYPRLKLAHNLLRDDGVIFVSISDGEIHNLRHLLDEIFGPENFVSAIIWQKVYAPKSSAKHFSEDHDYIVVYARNSESWRPNLLPRTEAQDAVYRNPDKDPRGDWRPNNLAARNYYSKGTYSITCPGGRVIKGPPAGSYWRVSKERLKELDAEGRIWWGADGNNVPAPKIFRAEVKQGRVPQTLWTYQEVGHSQEAKKELLSRVHFESSDSVFDTPKPTRLVMQMLRLATQPQGEEIVLDFFAGSGTTGDAVMQMNASDGGDRRFILVQLPELTESDEYATIADIAKARLRAAKTSIVQEAASKSVLSCDFGFRLFKLDTSSFASWNSAPTSVSDKIHRSTHSFRPDRSELDVVYELLLRFGLDLATDVQKFDLKHGRAVYVIGRGRLVACLVDDIDANLAERVITLCTELSCETALVVFKDAGFTDDVTKANTVQSLRQIGMEVQSL